VNFFLGETAEGHILFFASVGNFKAVEFVKQRPTCHTLDTDLLIMRVVTEWIMKQLDDRSYSAQKMLYTIKLIDLKGLGTEKLPIFVPELRDFLKTNIPPVMNMYPEHDILILVLNAPMVFRLVWGFASGLISKRQQKRVKMVGSSDSADAQAIIKSLVPSDILPEALGGIQTNVPLVFPLSSKDPAKVEEWMARTVPPIVRGQAPPVPKLLAAGQVQQAPQSAQVANSEDPPPKALISQTEIVAKVGQLSVSEVAPTAAQPVSAPCIEAAIISPASAMVEAGAVEVVDPTTSSDVVVQQKGSSFFSSFLCCAAISA
jgi:hypothetical protein